MLIPLDTMLDGVVRTLTDAVLPELPTGFARGQLYAAIDVLQNMRDRIEEKRALRDAEVESACAALVRAAAALRRADHGDTAAGSTVAGGGLTHAIEALARHIDEVVVSLATTPVPEAQTIATGAGAPSAPEAGGGRAPAPALRAALVDVLERLDALPAQIARAARAPIAGHLAAQAMRDTAVLKPSMLREISGG